MSDTLPVKPEVVEHAPAIVQPDLSAVEHYLTQAKGTVDTNPENVQLDIVARILRADSVQDILAPQAVEHARDLVDVPVEIRSVRFQESDFETGPGFYAVCEAQVIDDGRVTTFSCGGQNVMAQLYRLATIGAIPQPVVIRQTVKPTKRGYHPLWLEVPGPRDKVTAAVESGDGEEPF